MALPILHAAQPLHHPAQFLRALHHLGEGATQAGQAAQGLNAVGLHPGRLGRAPQLVGVLALDQLQQLGPPRFRHVQRIQQAGHEAHVAQLQHRRGLQRLQALPGKAQHLGRSRLIHCADALQPHLVDFFIGMALQAGAVHVFDVIVFFALTGGGLGIFCNAQGHVRLQGQQPPVQVGEGNHLVAGEKPPVLLIQAVFLKAAHVELAVPRLLIQCTQAQAGPLLRFQN